jgi:hypothetical protein
VTTDDEILRQIDALSEELADARRILAEVRATMSRNTPRAIMDEWLAAVDEWRRVKLTLDDLRRCLWPADLPPPVQGSGGT